MRVLKQLNLILLTLLSIAAGGAKIMQMPQEMEFFQSVGFSSSMLVALGAAQLIGGIMLVFAKTRLTGAVVTVIALTISTVAIFRAGNFGFGMFSTVPILLAGFVIAERIMSENISEKPQAKTTSI